MRSKTRRARWAADAGPLMRTAGPALFTGWSQVTTAGWAVGHLRAWYSDEWQTVIGRVVDELERVTGAGCTVIIMETLTTGSLIPAPPTPELAEYYTWLEAERGYNRHEIRTDYQFDSAEDAVARTEFFFGSELSRMIRSNGWSRLPEWTGSGGGYLIRRLLTRIFPPRQACSVRGPQSPERVDLHQAVFSALVGSGSTYRICSRSERNRASGRCGVEQRRDHTAGSPLM